ncbi:MAG: septum formation initiator family protein [Prevotellaceae bacterium]|jgi:cell division protein FtsB|nr:septum formation initiator family protein [Prevotellaceae bacterium]
MEFLKKIASFIPRPLRNRYVLTGLLFLVWILLFDPINVVDWIQERMQLRRLQQEQRQLEQQIDATTREVESFTHPDSLVKIARERFYFTGSGEEIFLVEE